MDLWQDKSGLGHDVTQSDPARQPLLAPGFINGLDGIDFGQTPNYYMGAAFGEWAKVSVGTLVTVHYPQRSGVQYVAGIPYDGGASWNGPFVGIQLGHGGTFGSLPTARFWHNIDAVNREFSVGNSLSVTPAVQSLRYDGNQRDAYIDATNVFSNVRPGAILYGTPEPRFMVGVRSHAALGEYYGGVIGEVLFFDRALTDTELADLHDHLMAKWGIGGNPPMVSGDFVTPPGDFSSLDRNPDDSFTRTLKNGTVIDYDAAGLMTAVTDRNGNATTYGYDANDRLTTITDPVGKVTTLAYGGDGLLDTVTDPASRVTSFQHDAAGDLTKIVDPDLSERDFAYDARHRLTSQESKRDFATTYDYDFHGRMLQANWPDGQRPSGRSLCEPREVAPAEVVGLIDPASGQGTQGNPAPFTRPDAVLASFTDGNDNTVSNSLDGFGASLSSTDALNRTVTAERDSDGLVTSSTAANGRIDDFTYDAKGNLLTRTDAVGDPLERTTTFVYEPVFNQVTQVTDPANKVTTFDYDANGNLTKITDALLGERSFTYNAQGQVLTETDGENGTTTVTNADDLHVFKNPAIWYAPIGGAAATRLGALGGVGARSLNGQA